MKLLSYVINSQVHIGVLLNDYQTVVDLQNTNLVMTGLTSPYLNDMISFLAGGEIAHELAERLIEFATTQHPPHATLPLADVTLLAPVPQPRSLRDCMAFEKHIVQATRAVIGWRYPFLAKLDAWVEKWRGKALFGAPAVWYEHPLYYTGNPLTVIGTDTPVYYPQYTTKLDYELEFGIFISRVGRNIPKTQAHQYIAGFTIFNDFSARDIQLREMQGRLGPAKGKSFDNSNALGPYLVTLDEISDPYNLTMLARVNGVEWSRGNSSEMFFDFAEIIAYISQEETLYPGEFIGSGTVGSGCGLELNRWLQPGDVIELEVEKLGILRNQVVTRQEHENNLGSTSEK